MTVKVDRAIAARARYVAEIKGVSLAEYLTSAAAATVNRDFDAVAKSEAKRLGGDPK